MVLILQHGNRENEEALYRQLGVKNYRVLMVFGSWMSLKLHLADVSDAASLFICDFVVQIGGIDFRISATAVAEFDIILGMD